MRTFLLLITLFFYSCSNQLQTEFLYKVDKKVLISELKLNERSSWQEIEESLKNYFHRFDRRLHISVNEKVLKVDGPEEAVKTFEYVFLTMFENKPQVFCEIDYNSPLNNLRINKKLELDSYTGANMTDKKSGLEFRISYWDKLNFSDFVNLKFSIFQNFAEKSQKLSFYCPFKNGEEEEFSFVVDDSFDDLKVEISGSVKISWYYENSYFYKSLTNSISRGEDKEIAVMPLLNGDSMEETIRSGSLITPDKKENRKLSIEQVFQKYLVAFGIELQSDDILIYNKNTYNILLMSSRKNCQMFKEIMAPLCISFTKKASLQGELLQRGKRVSTFQIPVVFNTQSELISSFEKDTDKESYTNEDFSVVFRYDDDLFEENVVLHTEIKHDYISEKNTSSIDGSTSINFKQEKEKLMDFKNGMSLKLKLNSYKYYD